MRWLLLACLVGCAQAGAPGGAPSDAPEGGRPNNPDSGFGMHIGAPMRPLDAFVPPIDAPPGMMTKTLDENTSDTLAGDTSVACNATFPDIGTLASKYYRVFALSSFGITTDFHVSKVAFQVEDCESAGPDCMTVTVDVGTYMGTPGATLSTANLHQLATASADIPMIVEDSNGNTPGGTVSTPISATIPAGQNLYFEIDAPDGTDTYQLYVGANAAGQSALSYTTSKCAGATPVDIGTTTSPASKIDLLMTVTGTY
jgi:hypothetical protein